MRKVVGSNPSVSLTKHPASIATSLGLLQPTKGCHCNQAEKSCHDPTAHDPQHDSVISSWLRRGENRITITASWAAKDAVFSILVPSIEAESYFCTKMDSGR
jgi:hypothetical protein